MENNFSKLRKNRNLSKKEMAKVCNTSASSISGWERGIFPPSKENLNKIFDGLNCTEDEKKKLLVFTRNLRARNNRPTKRKKVKKITNGNNEIVYITGKVLKQLSEIIESMGGKMELSLAQTILKSLAKK